MTTWWTNVDGDPWKATLPALSLLVDARVPGDTGADLYAPWRRPRLSVVYSPTTIDLHSTGLVTADAPEAAALRVVTPTDPTLTVQPAIWRSLGDTTVPLTDAIVVLRDVAGAPGTDAQEAAAVLRSALPELLGWPP
jgi:hypothetical protein